jgi:hypothetical protein
MMYEICSNETIMGKRVEAIEKSHHGCEGKHLIDAPANTSSSQSSLGSYLSHSISTVLPILSDPNLTTAYAFLRGSRTHGRHMVTVLGCMGLHKQIPTKEGLHSLLPWTKLIKPLHLNCVTVSISPNMPILLLNLGSTADVPCTQPCDHLWPAMCVSF